MACTWYARCTDGSDVTFRTQINSNFCISCAQFAAGYVLKKGIEKGAEEEEEIDITPEKKALDRESTSSVKDVKVEDSVTL